MESIFFTVEILIDEQNFLEQKHNSAYGVWMIIMVDWLLVTSSWSEILHIGFDELNESLLK